MATIPSQYVRVFAGDDCDTTGTVTRTYRIFSDTQTAISSAFRTLYHRMDEKRYRKNVIARVLIELTGVIMMTCTN